ncbi:MAG: hypothetical protein JW995_12305 [Melioribacteraceae bacterium]|nr:hypothetical protein [Melioribacteraceae bacterium]
MGYEFSFFQSIFLGFVAGIIIINSKISLTVSKSFVRILYQNRGILLFTIFVPVIISIISTKYFTVCPLEDGLMFYFVITVPAVLIGVLLAYSSSLSFNKYRKIIFTLSYFVLLLLPLLEIYYRPQIYLYNPIFGFFPGTIYDEDIAIDNKLLLYRVISMLPILIIILAEYMKLSRKLFFPVTIVLYLILFGIKPFLGFSTTEDLIRETLAGELITDNIIMTYPESLNKKEINNLVLHHEFYLREITKQAGIDYKQKIHSIVFENSSQKRELFGAGAADVAKPWLNQIYIEADSYNKSLKHEMVHVIASEIGSTIFKISDNFNPAVLEGYAMAIENNYSDYDINYLAAIAGKSGYSFSIENLFTSFSFFSGISSVSYIFSGSFVKFLIERFGIEKVNAFYSDTDFVKIFGSTVRELQDKYYSYIDSINYQVNKNTAQLFFGTLPIFKKTCPRVTANNLNRAWVLFNNNKFDEAFEVFKETYSYSGTYSALLGQLLCFEEAGEYQEAFNLIAGEFSKYDESSYEFNLQILYADYAARMNNINFADSLYKNLSSLEVNEYYSCIARTREAILNYGQVKLVKYLNSDTANRLKMLDSLLNNNNYEYMLSIIINLSNNLGIEASEIYKKYYEYFELGGVYSYYNYYMLSNFYLSDNNWNMAREMALKSTSEVLENRKEVYFENLEKTRWIFNFADSILSNIFYRNK